MSAEYDDHDMDDDDCPNCGGEGVTYSCIDGCCLDADEGCDLCAIRCDWCNPRKPVNHENNPLSEILSDALDKAKAETP